MKVLTSLTYLARQASARGYLSQPAATFPNGIDTKYNTIITETIDPAFQGRKWNDSPEANTKMFTKTFPNSKFKTLRAMLDTAAPDCGNTVLTGTPVDVSAMSSMTWQNDQEQKGFVSSHHGPCEAWIDDTRVAQSDDCVATYTGYPAEIPVDFSVCSGDCTFTFYWLALHEANWQVYKQCTSISNRNGAGSPAVTPAVTTPYSTPAATTPSWASGSTGATTPSPTSMSETPSPSWTPTSPSTASGASSSMSDPSYASPTSSSGTSSALSPTPTPNVTLVMLAPTETPSPGSSPSSGTLPASSDDTTTGDEPGTVTSWDENDGSSAYTASSSNAATISDDNKNSGTTATASNNNDNNSGTSDSSPSSSTTASSNTTGDNGDGTFGGTSTDGGDASYGVPSTAPSSSATALPTTTATGSNIPTLPPHPTQRRAAAPGGTPYASSDAGVATTASPTGSSRVTPTPGSTPTHGSAPTPGSTPAYGSAPTPGSTSVTRKLHTVLIPTKGPESSGLGSRSCSRVRRGQACRSIGRLHVQPRSRKTHRRKFISFLLAPEALTKAKTRTCCFESPLARLRDVFQCAHLASLAEDVELPLRNQHVCMRPRRGHALPRAA